jgi:hypothetical protein
MKNIKLIVDNESQDRLTRTDREGPQNWPLVGLTLDSFLQIIEMDRQTCLLDVFYTGDMRGQFYFIQGSLHNAECGSLDGEEAALEMMSWDNVRLNIRHMLDTGNIAKKITKSLMLLLMESSRRRDEREGAYQREEPEEVVEGDERDWNADTFLSEGESASAYGPGSKFKDCIDLLRKDMDHSLIGSVLIDRTEGSAVTGYQFTQATVDLFNQLTGFFGKMFAEDSREGICRLKDASDFLSTLSNAGGLTRTAVEDAAGRYYLLDLEEHQALFCMLFDDHQWGILFDSEKTKLGLFFNVIVPRMVKSYQAAIAMTDY